MRPTSGSLFTGAGGLDLAVEEFFGAETLWRSDIKPAACSLIEHYWPSTNLGDITTIDWDTVPPVDIVTGGFPCTDISLAGKQAGLIRYGEGKTRSGLWAEMCRAIKTLRPALVVAENVRALTNARADSDMEPCPWCLGDGPASGLRALGGVLADLANIGYDAAWCGLSAADIGAPHGRFRIFIVAWPATDTEGDGRNEGWTESTGLVRGSDVAVGRGIAAAGYTNSVAGPQECPRQGRPGTVGKPETVERTIRPDGPHVAPAAERRGGEEGVNWGPYQPTVDRWASILGRPAPQPTVTGPKGGEALSPDLTDWMMGWPEGWTDVPGLTRAQRLSLGGDGVVPQQAIEALRRLCPQIGRVAA